MHSSIPAAVLTLGFSARQYNKKGEKWDSPINVVEGKFQADKFKRSEADHRRG
jgi:hypothetical protein